MDNSSITTDSLNANETTMLSQYDYIIVGAGSGGCVVARRLVDNTDANILILEAGDGNAEVETIENPLRWLENIGSVHDYFYPYQPSDSVNGRTIYAPRGKVLGGSGSINAMVWTRGNKDDYNGWANAGNVGWDYNSVLPLFKKIEDWEGGETDFHGSGGPIHIQNAKGLHWIDSAVVEAGITYGMPYREDVNGPEPEGVGPMSTNIGDGTRSSPFKGYLKPVMRRKNITVITDVKVLKLNLKGSRCVGVDFIRNKKVTTVTASEEVILSAGAIDTPRILMLSGVGGAAELEQLNIRTKINLAGVGQNLQDHPLVSVVYEAKEALGKLTYNLGGSNLFWKSSPARHKSDLMLVPIQYGIVTDETAKQLPLPANAFSMFVTLVDVRSRGYIKMKSANPDGPLEIQPNFISDPEDLEALATAVELCMELALQPSLKNIIRRWVSPAKWITRNEIISFVKNACSTYFHPVGTCAMGTGNDAVVNNELKVYGVEGLRIADASVMPQIPTCNTNAPTLMIGEFASELILGKRKLQSMKPATLVSITSA